MDFFRRYLFELGCAAAGIVGIVAAVIAHAGFSQIRQEMSKATSLATQIEQLMRSPLGDVINENAIAVEQARVQKIEQQYQQVRQVAQQINRRSPLRDDVFPKPQPGREDAPYLFRADYRQRFNELLQQLQAGDAPSQDEVDAVAELIAQEQRVPDDQMRGLESGTARPQARRLDSPNVPGNVRYDRSGSSRTGRRPSGRPGPETALSPQEQAKFDPVVRASIAKARQIRMYASLDSFDVKWPVYDEGARPTPEQMWLAQVSLWVQEDLVRGLAELNDQQARQIAAANAKQPDKTKHRPIDVTTMPVKHLLAITVTDYIPPAVTVAAGPPGQTASPSRLTMREESPTAYRTAGVLGSALASFTGRACNDLYDVVQFQVQLVIDSRDLLRVINAICRQNFFIPLQLSYEAVPPNPQQRHYVYGPEPVVQVTLDFEAYFFRELYEPLMPESIKMMLAGFQTGQVTGGRMAMPPGRRMGVSRGRQRGLRQPEGLRGF